MKHTNIIIAVTLGFTAALSAASATQLQHTFVSSQGNDANNCSLATPCRHLQAALAATLAGGEIDILDSAGYNNATTVTITQAVSIVAPLGIEAEIAPPSDGTGIVINAGVFDAVRLRGLTIDGGDTGYNGIVFNTGQSLTVQNCVIRNMNAGGAGAGIYFAPTAGSHLFVSHTVVSDNAYFGIYVFPSGSGTVQAVFNDVEANNNLYGIYVNADATYGAIKATATGTVAAGNGEAGFLAQGQTGTTTFMLDHVVAANNYYGVFAQNAGATVWLYQSMLTGNTNGWGAGSGGVVQSYGNNSIDGNGANQGAPTAVGLK